MYRSTVSSQRKLNCNNHANIFSCEFNICSSGKGNITNLSSQYILVQCRFVCSLNLFFFFIITSIIFDCVFKFKFFFSKETDKVHYTEQVAQNLAHCKRWLKKERKNGRNETNASEDRRTCI